MQIISGAEAYRRLRSPENLLNKIAPPPTVGIVDSGENERSESSEVSDSSSLPEEAIPSEVSHLAHSPHPELSTQHTELLEGVLEMVDADGRLPPKYRGQRGKQMPDVLRAMIGIDGHFESTQVVAKEYGVSPTQVSQYKAGKVGGKDDEDLQTQIESELGKVRKKAQRKLMQALSLIDRDSMAGLDAVQLANIAHRMSAVVNQSIPAHLKEAKDANEKRPQFVVVVPPMNDEAKYKQIEVGG